VTRWALLLLLGLSLPARADDVCPADLASFLKSQGYSEIELSESTAKQFEVEATLNDKIPLLLIVDTGASMTIFDRDKLEDLGIEFEKSQIELMAFGGKQKLYGGQIQNLSIGSASTGPIEIFGADLDDLHDIQKKTGSRKADGLIGADFLSRYSAVIEIKHSKLYLRTK
jgi:predicted aspartyl protease